jgi:hypothetical protein
MRISVVLLALSVLSGCASTVIPSSEASAAHSILNASMAQPAPGKVSQTFKRDRGLNNGACAFTLYSDGIPFAELRASQIVTIYLSPGEHVISVTPGFCGGGDAEMMVNVAPMKPRTYRVGVDAGGALRLQPTAF